MVTWIYILWLSIRYQTRISSKKSFLDVHWTSNYVQFRIFFSNPNLSVRSMSKTNQKWICLFWIAFGLLLDSQICRHFESAGRISFVSVCFVCLGIQTTSKIARKTGSRNLKVKSEVCCLADLITCVLET